MDLRPGKTASLETAGFPMNRVGSFFLDEL